MNKILILFLTLLSSKIFASDYIVKNIKIFKINSAITPATLDYIDSKLNSISDESLIILSINTPGGLVSITKDIITRLSDDSRPIVAWITPEGASAASAGAIIASSAHFIFMSKGTHLGAATPVSLGSDISESDERKKAMSDLAALTRSLNEKHKRPTKRFEEMVLEARSFTNEEALREGIINATINNKEDIIKYLQGKSFEIKGQHFNLKFSDQVIFNEVEPTLGQKILEVLANPNVAYFLFLIGTALIYFEFQAPGGYIAGSVGVGFIIFAAIAFQVLPLNWGAFALIILGCALFILELFLTSYGLLSIAGIIAFVLGTLFLFHGESGYISIEYSLIFSSLGGFLLATAVIAWYLFKRKDKLSSHTDQFFFPIKERGIVMEELINEHLYQIKVRGEIWKAKSNDKLKIHDLVLVETISESELILNVKKINSEE